MIQSRPVAGSAADAAHSSPLPTRVPYCFVNSCLCALSYCPPDRSEQSRFPSASLPNRVSAWQQKRRSFGLRLLFSQIGVIREFVSCQQKPSLRNALADLKEARFILGVEDFVQGSRLIDWGKRQIDSWHKQSPQEKCSRCCLGRVNG